MDDYIKGWEWSRYLELRKERPEAFQESELLPIIEDENVICQFVADTGKKIGVVYESNYNMMVVDLIAGQNGTYYPYERILPRVKLGAIVTVPVCEGKYVLLKQYRHSLRETQYAFPRGFGEPGISPEANATKELEEEISAEIITSEHLGVVVADSGLSGNKVDVFLCHVRGASLHFQYEGIQELVMLTARELECWIAEGRINDGFTLAAYQLHKTRK